MKDIDELYDYSNVHKMEEPLYNYDEFCAKLGVIPFHYPKNSKQESSYSIGYKDIELEENRKIRIVSFNTATELNSKIVSGYLESSNVQAADEMVNMIIAQRAYEMNSKAITASDEMLQQANNLRSCEERRRDSSSQ